MFYWFLIFAGLVVGIVFFVWIYKKSYEYENLGFIGAAITIFVLIMTLIAVPWVYFDNLSYMQDFKALKDTVQSQRLTELSQWERLGLTQKIIEANQWLQRKRFWNQYKLIDPLIPPEVDELEFIK